MESSALTSLAAARRRAVDDLRTLAEALETMELDVAAEVLIRLAPLLTPANRGAALLRDQQPPG